MIVRFVVYNIYGMGGTVRTVSNIANYLADQGYRVEIISIKRTSTKPLFKLNKNIILRPLVDNTLKTNKGILREKVKQLMMKIPSVIFDKNEDLYKMVNLYVDYKLRKKLKNIKGGILVTTIPSLNIYSAKVVDKSVIKIGQEHKTYDVHHKSIQSKINKYYKELDAISCLTYKDVEDYRRQLDEQNIKTIITNIANATDVQYQSSTLKNKVIISAGRFSEEKGFDMLIEAFSKACKKTKDKEWTLKLFGSGQEKYKYQELIERNNMTSNIKLLPTSSKLIDEMKDSSIYALTSRRESFGMVIIEAMSVGVPCIAFECDGPKEIITNNVNGVLVEKENVESYAKSLIDLMENEEKRITMGKKAKIDSQEYSMDIIGEQWIDLFNKINISKKIKC